MILGFVVGVLVLIVVERAFTFVCAVQERAMFERVRKAAEKQRADGSAYRTVYR